MLYSTCYRTYDNMLYIYIQVPCYRAYVKCHVIQLKILQQNSKNSYVNLP